jgi:hypothetical protein
MQGGTIARFNIPQKTLWHYPIHGATFMGFAIPVVRARDEKRARTTG